jgi:4-carboxymuconolactone decarboxylase
MMKNKLLALGIIMAVPMAFATNVYAQNSSVKAETSTINTSKTGLTITKKQQSIVPIAGFTAKGDMVKLSKALNQGLDAGLTVNEIKEVLVQLYAYTGFPRSLNALNAFMTVLDERKKRGITDNTGKAPNPFPTDKTSLELGTEIQTRLVGRPAAGKIYEFSPEIDQFLKGHLFGDIFGRDNLDFKTREIATISALATLGNVEAQLGSHLNVGMYNGLTPADLQNILGVIKTNIGRKEGNAANEVLKGVLKQRQNNK